MNNATRQHLKGHTLVILRVRERDAFGRPTKCDVGYEDTTFQQLKDGDEFITAYVPKKLVLPKTKGKA